MADRPSDELAARDRRNPGPRRRTAAPTCNGAVMQPPTWLVQKTGCVVFHPDQTEFGTPDSLSRRPPTVQSAGLVRPPLRRVELAIPDSASPPCRGRAAGSAR